MTATAWLCKPVRTPFTRAVKGAFATTRSDDLLAALFRHIAATLPAAAAIDEVIIGCAYPEGEQGRNVARAVTLGAGLPDSVPAMTLTRLCASSLEATAVACARVRLGEAALVLVGGMETMSRIPLGGAHPMPNPAWSAARPEIYIAMGETGERVAKVHGISRNEQDAWALRSHQRAAAARARGVFAQEIVPFGVGADPATPVHEDDSIRADTSAEKLASLRPAFAVDGSVTAGNSCPTSDGASALLVASAEAVERFGLEPLGRFVSYAVAGVDPALMGIGPVAAVPRALARAGLTLADMERVELNEAFASQVVAVMRALGLPEDRTNVNGGAIALGHPLGASGARLAGTLLRELARSRGRYGLATLCVGGGMGAAMVVERTA